MAVQQPTFGSTLGGYVSSTELQSAYLRNQPWLNEVLLAKAKPASINEMLIVQGHMRSGGTTNLPVRYHIEKDRYTNFIIVDAAAAPAIGANQTLTVAAGTYNQNGESKAYVGAIVRYPDGSTGRITAQTAAANNNVMTIQPVSWPQLPAVAQNTQLILLAPAVGENYTPITDYLHTDVWAYRHGMQHINWSTILTDFKAAFDQNGKFTAQVKSLPSPFTGGMVDTWYSYELDQWFQSKMEQWNSTIVLGQQTGTTGPLTLDEAETINGIFPFLQSGANQFVTPAGNYTVADLEVIAQGFIQAGYGSVKHNMWCGRQIEIKLNNLMLSLGQQNNRQGETYKDYYDMAYTGLKGLGGHDFSYTRVDAFSDPQTGLPGAGFEYVACIIPEATVADTITGAQVPLLSIYTQDAYKNMEGAVGSGMFKWTSRKGPDFVGPNETVTSQNGANHLQLIITGAYQTVFCQPDQFGLIQ